MTDKLSVLGWWFFDASKNYELAQVNNELAELLFRRLHVVKNGCREVYENYAEIKYLNCWTKFFRDKNTALDHAIENEKRLLSQSEDKLKYAQRSLDEFQSRDYQEFIALLKSSNNRYAKQYLFMAEKDEHLIKCELDSMNRSIANRNEEIKRLSVMKD